MLSTIIFSSSHPPRYTVAGRTARDSLTALELLLLDYKIFNPNILSRFSKKDLSKFVILIGHNENKIKKDISNQILKYNIKKNNIIKINFFKELHNV